jgi:hypothetical protein
MNSVSSLLVILKIVNPLCHVLGSGILIYKYKTIYVNFNPTHLIKLVKPLNFNLLILSLIRVGFVNHAKKLSSLHFYEVFLPFGLKKYFDMT